MMVGLCMVGHDSSQGIQAIDGVRGGGRGSLIPTVLQLMRESLMTGEQVPAVVSI